MAKPILGLVILVLAGCASAVPETPDEVAAHYDAWVGRNVAQLMEAWGEPEHVAHNGASDLYSYRAEAAGQMCFIGVSVFIGSRIDDVIHKGAGCDEWETGFGRFPAP